MGVKHKSYEVFRHLVQGEDSIRCIHDEELPPDEYYDELGPALSEVFPGAEPSLVEHAVALDAAFDTATTFSMNFGKNKFQKNVKQPNHMRARETTRSPGITHGRAAKRKLNKGFKFSRAT